MISADLGYRLMEPEGAHWKEMMEPEGAHWKEMMEPEEPHSRPLPMAERKRGPDRRLD
jgi:hypothetical protein